MTDRREWGLHVLAKHPEMASLLKQFNEIFDARVIKMEVEGDPKSSWGQEVDWQTEQAVTPYFSQPSPQKVDKYKSRKALKK